jgi:EsV-1-7 cysteine-rich motif
LELKNVEILFVQLSQIYGYKENRITLYCKKHKLANMIDVANPRCLHEECDKLASFHQIDSKKRLYCAEHKLENMINSNHIRRLKCNK